MDRAIPLGRKYGIGLDAILGLVPGLGDVASGALSALIIFRAHREGVPRPTLLRMVANVGIDSTLGSVPLIGDLFDIAFQANIRNLELYRDGVRGGRRTSRDWGFLAILLVAVGVLAAIPILLLFWVVQSIGWF